MNNIEQRLTNLEMRFTFQEETITQLDQVVAQCNLQIQQLVKENHQLRQMLRSLAPETTESPDE
jgi:SlyX protein